MRRRDFRSTVAAPSGNVTKRHIAEPHSKTAYSEDHKARSQSPRGDLTSCRTRHAIQQERVPLTITKARTSLVAMIGIISNENLIRCTEPSVGEATCSWLRPIVGHSS
jgi:hypothetical protein